MRIPMTEHLVLAYEHEGKTPWLRITDSSTDVSERLHADYAAEICGVSRRTISRWCDGTQEPPLSALRLLKILVFGDMPWEHWDHCQVKQRRDQWDNLQWMIVSHQWAPRFHFTPGTLNYFAAGMDQTASLQREIDTLRETVNALTTRQAPPLPCAEIIPLKHYQNRKDNNQSAQ